MQIKFKKQIDIELDRNDLLEAVRDLLAKHGQVISNQELEEVKFINSPQTGIRATLKVTEESINEDKPQVEISTAGATVSAVELEPVKAEETVFEPEPQEAPGEVATSTVEDVAPADAAVDEVIERAFTPAPETEEEDEAVPADAAEVKKSLFH